jgi:hypothetical protein
MGSLSTIPEKTVVSLPNVLATVFLGGRRNRRVTGKIMHLTQRSIDATSRTRFMIEMSSKIAKYGIDPDTRDARKN